MIGTRTRSAWSHVRSRVITRAVAVIVTLSLATLASPALILAQGSRGQSQEPLPAIAEKTAGMERIDGFFPLYWDADAGQLWMELGLIDTEVLNITGMGAGLGSNDIGIDRGQLAGSRIVRFERIGRKILMVQPNYRFRSSSDNPSEVQAVTDAFARSILWDFTVAAETDERVLVDMNGFLLRDATGLAGRLRPGTYRFDAGRSSIYMPMTKGFPKNTEMEAELTFVRQPGGGGGGFGGGAFEGVSSVAASGEAASLRVHQSFVELPDDDYEPRLFDPRSGYGAISYQDYSAPLGESMTKRFIRRHRLKKVDPSAAMSDPVEPIVYYLDPGVPEPIRSALLDGARWWNQAFEAAGYRNAFQVEIRPDSISPLDVRYNVINWAHRSTRGWSYGGSVTDPRTGEIIKGSVTLGSLRIRQDYMIAEGLLAPYDNGDETPPELAEWSLARIRQLSAHEVGHTIGLGHNYYDSELGRISVMDYPHPLITLNRDGSFDFSQVYDVGMGEWDIVTVAYGYQDLPPGTDEAAVLRSILDDAWDRDVLYLSNQDISAHPRVDQWSNGTEAAAELNRMMEVRAVALSRFGETAIKQDMPLATMEEVLVPLYMHHRYQVTAAASVLGGIYYIYAMRGDGRVPVRPVPAAEQQTALDALLATLDPAALVLPRSVLQNLPPRPSGYGRSRELFPRYTGSMFDAITPAVVSADHTVASILQSQRAARMVEQHALDPSLPGLDAVIGRLIAAAFDARAADSYQAEVNRSVQRVVVDRLMALAANAAMPQVRAIASAHLEQLRGSVTGSAGGTDSDAAHKAQLARDITRFLERPAGEFSQPSTMAAPPGAPIGEPALEWLRNLEPGCWWSERWWK
ncbi:MAG: zinc-dependent metalloprotease [Gemmatimonadota bacterium]|nr:MAG: zinc-dependent metalloprotease [Gemmatimonadota bacterium]